MKYIILAIAIFHSTVVWCQPVTPPALPTSKPFVLGVVEEIYSAELAESRVLNIYLPEGYSASDTNRYPVVYLLDGGADEDFIHIVGLYQFNNFSWIDRVPKSIVVGIANTSRTRDLTYQTSIEADQKRFPTSGHSDKFIRFIEKELQPHIDKKYNTTSFKTIIGQSLGGLLAAEVLLKKPKLFNQYIIVSPSIWWDNGSLLNVDAEVLQKSYSQPTQIYIGVGKEGLTPGEFPRVSEVDANLLAEKLQKSESPVVKTYFDYQPEEDHATILHKAVFNALRLLNPVK